MFQYEFFSFRYENHHFTDCTPGVISLVGVDGVDFSLYDVKEVLFEIIN